MWSADHSLRNAGLGGQLPQRSEFAVRVFNAGFVADEVTH